MWHYCSLRLIISVAVVLQSVVYSLDPEAKFRISSFQHTALPQLGMIVAAERLRIPHNAEQIMLTSPQFIDIFAMEISRLERRTLGYDSTSMHKSFMAASVDDVDLLVGFVDVILQDPQFPELGGAYISELIVREGWRGQGVAKELMKAVEVEVTEVWKEPVQFLRVETDNIKAMNLYQKCGFIPVAVETFKYPTTGEHTGYNIPSIPFEFHQLMPYDRLLQGYDLSDIQTDGTNNLRLFSTENSIIMSRLHLFEVLRMMKRHQTDGEVILR